MTDMTLTDAEKDALDAATFRRLLKHLDDNKEVQNIDLMILANFCRNCLSKWYKTEAEARDLSVSIDDARTRVYGMAYSEWKDKFQPAATPEQLEAFNARAKC